MTPRLQRSIAVALLAFAGAALAAPGAGTAQPADALVHAPQKTNGSGVDVRYRVQGDPVAGQPVRVEIVLGRVSDPAGASLRLVADRGLRLEGGAVPVTVPAGEGTTVTVTVVPQNEGLAYLNVFTTQRGTTSSTSIPIQTGLAGASRLKGGHLKDTPEGDKILSMPVK